MVSAGYNRQRDGVAEYRKRKKQTKKPLFRGIWGKEKVVSEVRSK